VLGFKAIDDTNFVLSGPSAMESSSLAAKSIFGLCADLLFYCGLEMLCWVAGLALLGYALLAKIHEIEASDARLRAFALSATAAATSVSQNNGPLDMEQLQAVDQSLWSKKRTAQFVDIHKNNKEGPPAVLRIDDSKILVSIYLRAADFNLNRGAGWVEETARVDGCGNIGLAAHSFFARSKMPSEVRR
jgi:hypothetical protein